MLEEGRWGALSSTDVFWCRWEGKVVIVAADMRYWEAPEKADILVSELLGSFGDNELSPECLDGAQRFLREDGISIPTAYTSYIQPITTSKLWNDVRVSSQPNGNGSSAWRLSASRNIRELQDSLG